MSSEKNWLLHPQYRSFNEVLIDQSIETSHSILTNLDFSHSYILKSLCALSGFGMRNMNLAGLLNLNFIVLEQQNDHHLILGIKGKFWKIRKEFKKCTPKSFIQPTPGYSRVIWTFRVSTINQLPRKLSLAIEIESPDKATHAKMSLYWYFIRPFSYLIRREMLLAMKRSLLKKE